MPRRPKDEPPRDTRSVRWLEGFQAYKAGKDVNVNPYPHMSDQNKARVEWFDGWYDAKHLERWPDWLD